MRTASSIQPASRTVILLVALAAIVFLTFSPVLGDRFTSYDDSTYVTDNPRVSSGLSWANAGWAFTSAHASNWHPLTWLSHQLDCTLFGLAPAGHHLTSLLLHVANTLLLFLWLSGATGLQWRSAFVALVFGLHPLHVESVAWVAERKDVLSTMFWMLTLLAYSAYVRKPGTRRYLTVAALFTAGLLSKPMLVTVPLLLLLIDWWPLGRIERWPKLIREKLPLITLSALACAATLWAQREGGSVTGLDQLPLALRLSNAAVSYIRYLGKTIWPVDLAAFYPFPLRGIPPWEVAASVIALAGVTWLAIAARRRRPWLAAGWCWYLLTLLPVIGIVQAGMQAMADRYMYVPMIGLLIAITWECGELWERSLRSARLMAVAGGLAVVACAILSWRQTYVWKDGLTLFTHALQVTDENFVAQDNLGVELDRRGQFEEALAHYRETLRIKPGDRHGEQNYAQASFAKGERLFTQGRPDEALAVFREGLRYRPRNAMAHTYAGIILTRRNQLAAAIQEFRMAIGIDPALGRAYLGLGVALAQSGHSAEAERAFADSARYDPASVEASYDLCLVRMALGRNAEALQSCDAALRLQPDFGPAHAARTEALYALGRYQDAWRAMRAAKSANAQVDPGIERRLAAKFGR